MTSSTTMAEPKCAGKREPREETDAREECRREMSSIQRALQRALQEVVDHQQIGPEGLRATQPQLIIELGRIQRVGEQIDEAFAGQVFLPNQGPTSPANRRRFNTFVGFHKKRLGLLEDAMELWAFSCGMKMDDDWVPIVIVYMDHEAAKARANANRSAAKG